MSGGFGDGSGERRLCVFAGSSVGRRDAYRDTAGALGMALGRRGIGLVYGGAAVGLMGVVADAALAGGGQVIGVLPEAQVEFEIAHTGLTALEVVGSMHARKARMAELARFVKPSHRGILLSDADPDRLIDALLSAEVPSEAKWIDR